MDVGTVVGAVGLFVQVIFEKYVTSRLERWATRSGLLDEFHDLKIRLQMVRALLEALRHRPIRNEGLRELLAELRSAAYDADDILDEMEYYRLKESLDGRRRSGGGSTSLWYSWPSSSLSSSSPTVPMAGSHAGDFLASQFTRTLHIVDGSYRALPSSRTGFDWLSIAGRIKTVADRLDSVSTRIERVIVVEKMVAVATWPQEAMSQRQTSSLLTEPKAFGRDEETDDIIQSLLMPNRESGHATFAVLAIVGIGGVGKTTLAQLVYNDLRVVSSFDVRAWACVSNNVLDVRKVTVDVSMSIDGAELQHLAGLSSLDTIQNILREKLEGKKFLIILDDVWISDKWELLCAPFSSGVVGSRVIVTTRDENIAERVGTMPTVRLSGLRDEDFWAFFRLNAFGNSTAMENQKLTSIGRKIADKMHGIPLAAKTVGRLLNRNQQQEHWISILDSNLWELRQGPDDIFPVLLLSYQNLPVNLQRCFSYCSVYPRGHKFIAQELFFSWIAHGFVRAPRRDQSVEDVAREYLDDLIAASFIQSVDDYYMMHDLLHELAQSVSDDECLVMSDDMSRDIPLTVRHLFVVDLNQARDVGLCRLLVELGAQQYPRFEGSLSDDSFSFDDLRTLMFRRSSSWRTNGYGSVFVNFNKVGNIRMLSLPWTFHQEQLGAIGCLIHLRYLDLSWSGIMRLPETVCSLYHLQVLNVCNCRNLVHLPAGINNLINLRYLIADENKHFLARIPDIRNLSQLQELDAYYVREERGFKISQLKQLRELRGVLRIFNLESVTTKQEAQEAGLKDKRHLVELHLTWNHNLTARRQNIAADVLQALQPYPNLRHLSIDGYGGPTSPTWLAANVTLTYLESVYFRDCSAWEILPPFGQLPYLRKLHLIGMSSVRHIGAEFYGGGALAGFPCLEELLLERMSEWREWHGVDRRGFFPCLQSLIIHECPKLNQMPVSEWMGEGNQRWFPRLVTLEVKNCLELTQLPHLPHTTSLVNIDLKNAGPVSSMWLEKEVFAVHGFPGLTRSAVVVLQFQHLRAVKRFGVYVYKNLVLLPWKGLGEGSPEESSMMGHVVRCSSLSSLEELSIDGSGITEELLSSILPSCISLHTLNITSCPQIAFLDLRPLRSLRALVVQDCESLKSLAGFQTLAAVKKLTVCATPKFMEAWNMLLEEGEGAHARTASSVESLCVDDTSFLMFPIFRTLTALQHLLIDANEQVPYFTAEQEIALRSIESLQIIEFRNSISSPLSCAPFPP